MTREEQKIALLVHRIKDNCYEVAENLLKEHDKQTREDAIEKFVEEMKKEPFSDYVMDIVYHIAERLKEQNS